MRNLFLALVLANLAFAAWHLWFAGPKPPPRTGDEDLPGITLVSELPPDVADLSGAAPPAREPTGESAALAQRDEAAATGPSTRASQPGAAGAEPDQPAGGLLAANPDRAPSNAPADGSATRCTTIGPFRELAQAATAAANLRAAGYQPTQRVAEGDIWIGYWVYIEAIPTEAEANAILAKVREQGIADSYVIPKSDSGNLVSLGVFSEISGVSKQRERVRALGYEPKVVDRTRRATVYWVDVVLTGDQQLDFDAVQTPGRIIRLEQRSCDAPAP
jgi:cell division septation protein DedD